MMDATLQKVLTDYGLTKDAVWEHKQSKQTVMKHWACEHIAIKAGIVFDMPEVIFADPANKMATICVRGHIPPEDRLTSSGRSEWSFGEAAPYNTQQSYPFAMAEKRAKDRVILKLIGLHGKVYSEEETDDFKASNTPTGNNAAVVNAMHEGTKTDKASKENWKGPLGRSDLSKAVKAFAADLEACGDEDELIALLNSHKALQDQLLVDWPECWHGDGGDKRGIAKRIEEIRNVCRTGQYARA